MMNISLVGRLTKELQVRTFPTEKGMSKVATGTIAVKRRKFKKNGERESAFIQFQAWGKRADVLEKYTGKGSLVELIGEFMNNNYTDKNNIDRYELVFEVEHVELLESRNMTEQRNRQQEGSGSLPQDQGQGNENQQSSYQNAVNQEVNHQSTAADFQQPPIDGLNNFGANTPGGTN